MLVWIVDAGNFGCCLAYCMVSISFVILRKKLPKIDRPYKVKRCKLVGAVAVIMSGGMALMYIVPETNCTLTWQEWIIVGGWSLLGIAMGVWSKKKYKNHFAEHIE